jgi:hypothetical protein
VGERHTPKSLFNASMAREMMGHELQAFVHLRQYLGTPDLSETERNKAQERIRVLIERTPKLRVLISPANAAGMKLELHPQRASQPATDAGRSTVHIDGAILEAIAVPGYPGAYDLPIEPGLWNLESTASRHTSIRVSIEVTRARSQQVVLRLAPVVPGSVTARFTPTQAVAAGIDVTLSRAEPDEGSPEGPRTERLQREQVTWHLTPGAWTIEASAPGYQPTRHVFTATANPIDLEIALTPSSRGRPKARLLALSLGAGAGVTAIAGSIILGISGANWSTRRDDLIRKTDDDLSTPERKLWNDTSGRLSQNWVTANVGAGVLGAGLGLGLGSMTALLPRRRNLWIAETTVGAGLGIGGIVASVLVVRSFDTVRVPLTEVVANSAPEPEGVSDSLDKRHVEGIFSGLAAGVGVGLLVSGVVGLVHDRSSKVGETRASIAPYSSLTGAGLLLRRHF